MAENLVINGQLIPPETRTTVELSLPSLYTHTPITMPVHVVRGRREGARLFISAALHGDELNGVEIIRRLMRLPALGRLRGTLIAIPIVNVYGLLNNSRYLPDRRDLNRSFPGSERGSLAARLADLFMREIVSNSTHGIDLHTGAAHRSNLPQIRANIDHLETARLARAFGVPVVLNSSLRDRSLREAADTLGVPLLLYEAGEALRFDEVSIRAGVRGILHVMRELAMLPKLKSQRQRTAEPFVARSSTWTRAPQSGMLRAITPLGAQVARGEILAMVDDPFSERSMEVPASARGIVIGRTTIPLVHEGEAVFHVARFESLDEVAEQVEAFQAEQAEEAGSEDEPPIV